MKRVDREKVIKGLEICKPSKYSRTCGICPYREEMNCDYEVYNDALELLKEQEAVKPIPYHRSDGTIFKYECRQCRTKIFKMDLFCRHCGRSVKWNEA